MRRNGGGNATSTANRPSASEGGPARTFTTARPRSVSHGPGFAAASRKKTSRRLIDTPRPAGKRSPDITGRGNMKFKEDLPFANPEVAEQGLLELANAMEADHAGRLLVAVINKQFLAAGGSAEEYCAAVAAAVEHGWLTMHPSAAYLSFTQGCPDLFA